MKLNLPKKYLHLENRDIIDEIISSNHLRDFTFTQEILNEKYTQPKWCGKDNAILSSASCIQLLFGIGHYYKKNVTEYSCELCEFKI